MLERFRHVRKEKPLTLKDFEFQKKSFVFSPDKSLTGNIREIANAHHVVEVDVWRLSAALGYLAITHVEDGWEVVLRKEGAEKKINIWEEDNK